MSPRFPSPKQKHYRNPRRTPKQREMSNKYKQTQQHRTCYLTKDCHHQKPFLFSDHRFCCISPPQWNPYWKPPLCRCHFFLYFWLVLIWGFHCVFTTTTNKTKQNDISRTSFVIWLGHLPPLGQILEQDRIAQQLVMFSWFLEDFKTWEGMNPAGEQKEVSLVLNILERKNYASAQTNFRWFERSWREQLPGAKTTSSVGCEDFEKNREKTAQLVFLVAWSYAGGGSSPS